MIKNALLDYFTNQTDVNKYKNAWLIYPYQHANFRFRSLKLTPTVKGRVCLTCFLQAHNSAPPSIYLLYKMTTIYYIFVLEDVISSIDEGPTSCTCFFFFTPEREPTFCQMKTDFQTPCTPAAKCQSFQTSTLQCNWKKKSSTWSQCIFFFLPPPLETFFLPPLQTWPEAPHFFKLSICLSAQFSRMWYLRNTLTEIL